MTKNRLEAFSDGVIAIIITIMVLELRAPVGTDISDLEPMVPILLSYALSFIYIAIYWNNHHHMLHAASKVTGKILWANMHLLFWISLIPFCTDWINENHPHTIPVALYGSVLFMSGVAYFILAKTLISAHGANSAIANALGKDYKTKISLLVYAIAISLSFISVWIAITLYALVAVMWIVPDKRIENKLGN